MIKNEQNRRLFVACFVLVKFWKMEISNFFKLKYKTLRVNWTARSMCLCVGGGSRCKCVSVRNVWINAAAKYSYYFVLISNSGFQFEIDWIAFRLNCLSKFILHCILVHRHMLVFFLLARLCKIAIVRRREKRLFGNKCQSVCRKKHCFFCSWFSLYIIIHILVNSWLSIHCLSVSWI